MEEYTTLSGMEFYLRQNIQKSQMHKKKIEIKIEYDIEYGKFFYLRKPYITKKIKICGRDSSWIKSWKTEQITELVSKLSFLK